MNRRQNAIEQLKYLRTKIKKMVPRYKVGTDVHEDMSLLQFKLKALISRSLSIMDSNVFEGVDKYRLLVMETFATHKDDRNANRDITEILRILSEPAFSDKELKVDQIENERQAVTCELIDRSLKPANGTLKNSDYKILLALVATLDSDEYKKVDLVELKRMTKMGYVNIEDALKRLRKHKIIDFKRVEETNELLHKLFC